MLERNQEVDLSFSHTITTGMKKREDRYSANADVRISESKLLLKNISLNGGQIHGDEFIDIIPNGKYTIMIIPEKESAIDKFELDIISRWVKMRKSGMESGFMIVLPPGSGMVEKYIEYLKGKIINAGK
jgi:hypothetical protein